MSCEGWATAASEKQFATLPQLQTEETSTGRAHRCGEEGWLAVHKPTGEGSCSDKHFTGSQREILRCEGTQEKTDSDTEGTNTMKP